MKDYSRFRILVVDDEPSICESLLDYLEDFGFDVLASCGAHEALEILAKKPRDVAIIDIRLPGMNGDHARTCIHKNVNADFLSNCFRGVNRLEISSVGIQSGVSI